MNTGLRYLRIVAAMGLCGYSQLNAYGWGDEGHQAIALAAFEKLTPDAQSNVTAILQGMTIPEAATWPDKIRKSGSNVGPLANTPEGKAFNASFKKNREWHFVNLPLGTTSYRLDGPFASEDDVVHAIQLAISVLEDDPTAPPGYSKQHALCWLFHLVGDIHQPLHVGTGYFGEDREGGATLSTSVADAQRVQKSDQGGNLLVFGSKKLHSYWDSDLVKEVGGTSEAVKEVILQKLSSGHYGKNAGDYHDWALAWASHSVRTARLAYRGIEFGDWGKNSQGQDIIEITFADKAKYEADGKRIVTEQITKAAANLAELLNEIHW